MDDRFARFKKCCNPFQKPLYSPRSSDLRIVQAWMKELIPDLDSTKFICSTCRKDLSRLSKPGPSSTELHEIFIPENVSSVNVDVSSEVSSENSDSDMYIDIDSAMKCLNECVIHLGMDAINKKRLQDKTYCVKKADEVTRIIKKKIFKIDKSDKNQDSEVIKNLKDRFTEASSIELKCMLLSALPKKWSMPKIMENFNGATYHMVRKSKQIANNVNTSNTPLCRGRKRDLEVEELIKEFYNNDDISRVMPGSKDFVSMKVISVY